MDTKQRTGFTKTGFSKAGFGACGHFKECQLGKLTCFYEDIEPEVKSLCACYKRNHGKIDKSDMETESVTTNTIQDLKEESEKEMEQLSLF